MVSGGGISGALIHWTVDPSPIALYKTPAGFSSSEIAGSPQRLGCTHQVFFLFLEIPAPF